MDELRIQEMCLHMKRLWGDKHSPWKRTCRMVSAICLVYQFTSFSRWTPSIWLPLVIIYVVSSMSSPFRRLFLRRQLVLNDVPRIFMWDGAYGFKSLSEKNLKDYSNHSQMKLERQHFFLSYFTETLSVGSARGFEPATSRMIVRYSINWNTGTR